MRLPARIAEALEELYGENVVVHAVELARHFVEAQTLTGPGKLATGQNWPGATATMPAC